ncbi:MAG TPA: flagellin [Bryobacteraceae bacterium]|nr:flagellin [Bryobacteraceae bacterium]
MFPGINGVTQSYLGDLARTETQLEQTTQNVSSGIDVNQPSDDPAAVSEILQTETALSNNKQIQSNLSSVTTEVNTADSALQTAVQALSSAISMATEGASSTATADSRATLAQQVASIQQTLVGIAQTTVNGRYIFSGDQDTQPPYELDSTQPEGVQQLVTGNSTRMIQSVDGTSFAVALTAQQIFDAQNADGTPATGNVFAAVQNLETALANNDTAGISSALSSLQSASSYLNDQVAFYGNVENRVQEATSLAQKFQTQEQTQLSNLQDTDIPTAAAELTQLQTQEQASMSVEATLQQQKNLFSYLA